MFVLILGGVSAGSIFLLGYKLWVVAVLGLLWLEGLIVSALFGYRGFDGGGGD